MKNLQQQILSDIRVELTEQFKENFWRKGFFDKPWPARQRGDQSRLMLNRGNLMRSIKATIKGDSIVFTSSMPYASIHNEGGAITVTDRMKRFFWAKHIEAKERRQTSEADLYKAMALKKTGSTITIPQRQFIGDHPEVRKAVEAIITENLNDYFKNLKTN